jgi:hypothetical protein
MNSGSVSQSLVEPSTSVKSSVIVPEGIRTGWLTCQRIRGFAQMARAGEYLRARRATEGGTVSAPGR